jgi:hypothetical protein
MMTPYPNVNARRLLRSIPILGLAILATGCGKPFRATERVTLTADMPGTLLKVRSPMGDIDVHAQQDIAQVTAEAHKIGRGTSPAEAAKALGDIQVELAPDPDDPAVLVARASFPKHSVTRSYSVDWTVTAPPGAALDVKTAFGDVEAAGFDHGAKLSSDFGSIKADAGGEVQVSTEFGDVELRLRPDNPGKVSVRSEFGDARLYIAPSRTGRLTADTDFGDVRADLSGMTAGLLRKFHGSAIEVELGGTPDPSLDVSTDFGDVVIKTYHP